MKRAENCVDCKVTHIRFESDSLVFEFAKGKSHQDGEEHVGPWHPRKIVFEKIQGNKPPYYYQLDYYV